MPWASVQTCSSLKVQLDGTLDISFTGQETNACRGGSKLPRSHIVLVAETQPAPESSNSSVSARSSSELENTGLAAEWHKVLEMETLPGL